VLQCDANVGSGTLAQILEKWEDTISWGGQMTDKNMSRTEPLLPVELGPGKIKFAQGMKAGRWVCHTRNG